VEGTVTISTLRLFVPRGQTGQGLAEYALILALVGVLAVAALTFLGGAINSMMSDLGNAL
jgi:pilus assembly protein Flp/PilA